MSFHAELHPFLGRCSRCNAQVLWVKHDHQDVAIDNVAAGSGDLAIVVPLIPGAGELSIVHGIRSSYARHEPRCPKREPRARRDKAFSAFDRRARRCLRFVFGGAR
jgi:hypothetical protein